MIFVIVLKYIQQKNVVVLQIDHSNDRLLVNPKIILNYNEVHLLSIL